MVALDGDLAVFRSSCFLLDLFMFGDYCFRILDSVLYMATNIFHRINIFRNSYLRDIQMRFMKNYGRVTYAMNDENFQGHMIFLNAY